MKMLHFILITFVALGACLGWQDTARAQACAEKNAGGGGGCLSVGAACGTPQLAGTCGAGPKGACEFSCCCLDNAGGVIIGGNPPAQPKTSGPTDLSLIVLGVLLAGWMVFSLRRRIFRRT